MLILTSCSGTVANTQWRISISAAIESIVLLGLCIICRTNCRSAENTWSAFQRSQFALSVVLG